MWWNANPQNKTYFQRVIAPNIVGGRVEYRQSNRSLTAIIASVQGGGIDVWFGIVNGEGTPDLHFGQANHPVTVPLPEGTTELTLVGVGPEAPSATIIVGYI